MSKQTMVKRPTILDPNIEAPIMEMEGHLFVFGQTHLNVYDLGQPTTEAQAQQSDYSAINGAWVDARPWLGGKRPNGEGDFEGYWPEVSKMLAAAAEEWLTENR